MTIDTFIRYVLDLARKDGKGNVIQPSAIVNWLTFVMLDDFNNLLTEAQSLAERNNIPLANVIFDVKDLRRFVKSEALSVNHVLVGGINSARASLPDDFKYELGCTANMVNVELLSSTLLHKYRGSVLNGNPEESPKAFVGGGYMEVVPNDLTGLVLTYLRTPAKPFYDFCIDENDNEVFMPVGSYIIYNPNEDETELHASDGTFIIAPVIKQGISLPYTSQTVELDWDEINHVRFANNVAHKLGINLKNAALIQTQ